jgi:predicted O-linked N-acetylglucosamine transferase (SPINDLY family)
MSRSSSSGPGSGSPRHAGSGPPPEFRAAVEHHRAGRLREAGDLYQTIIRRYPRVPEPYGLLGYLSYQLGHFEQAVANADAAIALNPRFVDAFIWRGMALQAQSRFTEAEASYRRALALNPQHFDALTNLGGTLQLLNRPAEALPVLRQAVVLNSRRPEAFYSLGRSFMSLGQFETAIENFQQALRLRPDYIEAQTNLAATLVELHRYDAAILWMERALALDATRPELHFNLARALRDRSEPEEIERRLRQALELQPEYPEARVELALLLLNLSRRDEAIEHLRYTVETSPESTLGISSLLMTLNYDPDLAPEALAEEHRRLGAVITAQAASLSRPAPRARDLDPERRLRIGYLSSDFRTHSCAFFIEPLFRSHDRTQVEIVAYSGTSGEDATTERIRSLVDRWQPVRFLNDETVADRIAEDGIDILVDLAGHTSGGCPLLLAMKPAPVAMTWLGYPNTTGLAAVDYRITDAYADPPGVTDRFHTERLLRLEGGFLCYPPPSDAPGCGLAETAGDGSPVFGCFNTALKLNGAVAACWSQILAAVPGSILKLRALQFRYPEATEAARALFVSNGISPDRLSLSPWRASIGEGLADYAGIDVALDPFPYNGTTTTCEALWMGVPVVTLAGHAHAGRVGVSLLRAAGLERQCVASSIEDYVQKAGSLAGDPAQRRRWRTELRPSLAKSSLMDAERFAREIEQALRASWRHYCSGPSSSGPSSPLRANRPQ